MKRNILFVIACVIMVFAFAGCGDKEELKGYEGLDLNDIATITVPNEYTASDDAFVSEDKVVRKTWTTDGSVIKYTLLYGDGTNSKGDKDKTTIEQYTDDFAKSIVFIGTKKAYIGSETSGNVKDNLIKAYIDYDGYIVSVELENEDEPISKEQKDMFNKIIQSMQFVKK